ncbi:MAG: WD40/YVTN/BNR-like repeat-containing protein, partial [Pyrinomonadaceae bacterium]
MALTQVLNIEGEGSTVRYPSTWSGARTANVHKLFNMPAEQMEKLDVSRFGEIPQITIFIEHRKHHEDAVRRLKEIEAEAPSPSSFLSIGGWPALQRRHLAPKPLPGAAADGDNTELQITTAVAAGHLLVRLEARLKPNAPSQLIEEVEAIGRSLTSTSTAGPGQLEDEMQSLRADPKLRIVGSTSSPDSAPLRSPEAADTSIHTSEAPEVALAGSAGTSVRVTTDGGRDSEIEVAVSADGQDIVIGTNNRWHFSTDAGQTWNPANLGRNGNDPSVAWGTSGAANGTFYAANIATPSTEIRVSTDAGANFAFRANAYTCGQGGDPACGAAFPDQEHIATDRFNVAAGGDQVYSAWRHLDGTWGIVCSADSGNTWSTNGFFTSGDFPRVTVGQDGFVYVVYRSGGNIMLSKFNSCATDQNPMVKAIADQTIVAGITDVACPTPGLDRCNLRNTLSSPTLAVDDTDPNHVYAAYAVNTNPGGGGFPNCVNQA